MTPRFALTRALALTAGALMALISTLAQAAPHRWALSPEQTTLDIALTDHRAGGDAVSHLRAAPISGTVNAAGDIDIPLSLNQLDIIAQLPPLLTQRALKQEEKHIHGHVDPAVLARLAPGQSVTSIVTLWDAEHWHIATPLRLIGHNSGLIGISTPAPVSVDISPLLQQDNASLIMNLLGYQHIDHHIQTSFQGILTPQP